MVKGDQHHIIFSISLALSFILALSMAGQEFENPKNPRLR